LLGQFNLINYNAVEREMWHVASSMWHLGGTPCSCETETENENEYCRWLAAISVSLSLPLRFYLYFFSFYSVIVSKPACECGSIFTRSHTDTQI